MTTREIITDSINKVLTINVLGVLDLGHILLFALVLITFIGIFKKMRI